MSHNIHPIHIRFYRPDQSLKAYENKDKENNAGWDMIATETIGIEPGQILKVPVNIHLEIPQGHFAFIVPRSGLSSRGINIIPGTIDSGYRGQISAIVQNFGSEVFLIERGMRIAQMILLQHATPQWVEVEHVEELSPTKRGSKGFGESGLY